MSLNNSGRKTVVSKDDICECYCTGSYDRGCSCCNKTCGHWTATASPEEIEQWLIAR
jgi:hypothetical protein